MIAQDPNQKLMVAVADNEQVVGTLQLSFIPSLTYQGGWRAPCGMVVIWGQQILTLIPVLIYQYLKEK